MEITRSAGVHSPAAPHDVPRYELKGLGYVWVGMGGVGEEVTEEGVF